MKPKSAKPLLTRLEAEIMQTLWSLTEGTVHQVQKALDRELAYTTVLSVLRLLEQKGYVGHRADAAGGRAFVYVPAVPADVARHAHLRDLVKRLFGGKTAALVTGMIEEEKLSRQELVELRQLIDTRLRVSGQKERHS